MTGHRVKMKWGKETTYGTTASSIDKLFGPGTRISISRNNSMNYITGVGNRAFEDATAGAYQGKASVSFYLNAEYDEWLELLLGSVTKSGSGPYVYTYKYDATKRIPSFTIKYSKNNAVINPAKTNEIVVLNGCVINSGRISFENNGADTVFFKGGNSRLGTFFWRI